MPTPAHTPGPWKTSETVHSDGYTGKHYWTIYPQHAPADIIVALPVASDKENDRAEANARLIASAPTLAREHAEMRQELSALASILDGLVASMDMRSGFAQQTRHRVETARALLARIEGGQG